MYQNLFNYSPAEGNLCCFHFVAITNKTAMNIRIQVLCEHVSISLGQLSMIGMAGSYCRYVSQFLNNGCVLALAQIFSLLPASRTGKRPQGKRNWTQLASPKFILLQNLSPCSPCCLSGSKMNLFIIQIF